jgi:tetratricopeptide (TPR) repeat protein
VFGQLVRAHRLRLAWTQEELAAKTGLSVAGIRKIETGQVVAARQSTLRLLAAAFALTDAERARFYALAASQTGERPAGNSALAQLPADVYGFTGREEQLARLDALLPLSQASTAVVVSAISGMAGVGKTALAVHWAHSVADKFPDGQLYVNLRGFDPGGRAMAPSEALAGFLDALGVPPERIPPDLDAQARLYRGLLAGRRIMVVLDNARDADQVRPLLPGTSTALVIVTSRSHLTSLIATVGAYPLTLDLMSTVEARELLARRLGADRVAAEPETVEQIIAACARLPLALSITAARAQQTGFSLASLAAELETAGQRLDVLDAGDAASQVKAVFSWSYAALTPPAAHLFRLLSLHPGPDLSTAAAASLAGHKLSKARRLLTDLTRANVVTEPVPGRYAFHDLLRAYATDLSRNHDSDYTRHSALTRLLDHYVHTAYVAAMALDPRRRPITLGPASPAVTPERIREATDATAWFVTNHRALLAAVDLAGSEEYDSHAWQLAWSLTSYFDRHGHWQDWISAQQAALRATERLADTVQQAAAHRSLARAKARLGCYNDARTELLRSLDLSKVLGDEPGQAHAHHNLAWICEKTGRYGDALHHAQRAFDLFQITGNRLWQARASNAVGWFHALLGNAGEALTTCTAALGVLQELDDDPGQAVAWYSLGYAHHHLDQYQQALACYRRALGLYRMLNDHYYEADTLTRLGDTYAATGDQMAARHSWAWAADILSGLQHPDADGVRARLRANTSR